MNNELRVAICDDCEGDRIILRRLLGDYSRKSGQQFQITEYASREHLGNNPDELNGCELVFLGINKKGTDWLKAAGAIRQKHPELPIVLVTAYMGYALEGYKVRASRFLLKENLEQTITECLDDILKEIRKKDRILQFSFVEGRKSIKADEVVYIETARHKNIFYVGEQAYSIYKKLDEIEEELKGLDFLRIHQSFLVNMHYIDKISSYVLRLKTGKELSVPKARYPEVKRQFLVFKGE